MIAESNNPRLGPFVSVTGSQDYFTVQEPRNCEWEEDECLWNFRNDTGYLFVCSHLQPILPTRQSEQCLRSVFGVDNADFGGSSKELLSSLC